MRLAFLFCLCALMWIQQQIFKYDCQRLESERDEERFRLALLIAVVEHDKKETPETVPKLLRACPVPRKLSKLYHTEWELSPEREQ